MAEYEMLELTLPNEDSQRVLYPRRKLAALLLLLPALLACLPVQAENPLRRQIARIVAPVEAQVGVAVIIDGKDTLTVNNNGHYPLMSVMKFHQALAVAHQLEQHGQTPDTTLHIGPEDLPTGTYSPLRDRYPQGNIDLTVGELLAYTLQLSDNNACDILFRHFGGVAATHRYIASLGTGGCAIAATEADMHRRPETCYDNWSTPLSAALLMDGLAAGTLPLSEASMHFIRRTLLDCQTGTERLPAPLKGTDAHIGHKTGTSDRNASGEWTGINDVGFVLLPDGRRYTIAVLVKHSRLSLHETEQVIARISAAVYQYLAAPR